MELIGAVLFWLVVGLWAHHHQQFKAGKVKRPFFSFGSKPAPVAQAQKSVVRPRPQLQPQSPPSGINMVGGKLVYRRSPVPAAKSAPPAAAAKPTPPPAPSIIPLPKMSQVPPPSLNIPVALLAKLDRYTYNRSTSERLVRQAAECNPGKSGQWCAEKALWDLERDRH